MSELYHQLGYRYTWNLQSLMQDGTGDGTIMAPRYMDRDTVTSLPADIRQSSFFDPQFFLPGTDRGSLSSYEFFPEIVADGFSTTDYDEVASLSAELCIRFQTDNKFRYCVIPTRCKDGIPDDYIDSQMGLFVRPFLNACDQIGPQQPLLLQLIINDHMLRSRDFCNEVLNWATGILEIDGIYLIPHITQRPSKQIGDPDLLLALFSFVDTIRSNDMDIILGYLNTEGIPLLVTEPTGITMGSYENLRMFRLTAFKEKKPQQMRGPIPRIYIPKLLQWVDHRYMDSILRYIDEPEDFLGTTEYKELMFTPEYNWHFQKSEPYKHYFVGFSEQVSSLTNSTGRSRFEGVRDLCFSALDRFDELKQNGVVFDSDSGSSHIPLWLNVLNVYGRERGFIP